jgi:hypothetical protein
LVFSVVGAFLGIWIYKPDSVTEALAAGISWPVGFGALATKTNEGGDNGTVEERIKKIPPTWQTLTWRVLLGVLAFAICLDLLNLGSFASIVIWLVGLLSLVIGYYFIILRNP